MTKRLLMAVTLLCACIAGAQTAVQPIIQPHQTFSDGSGNPCAGCSLYSYSAGTTNPLATYTDASGTAQNTNPVLLDAAGGANIWIGPSAYKFVLVDTSGTTLWTADGIVAPLSGSSGPYLPLSGGTLTGALTAPYFQFKSAANACTFGQYISGWNASGWICSSPALTGTAAGDLSGFYPSPTVTKINGGAVPVNAAVLGTNASGQPISQTAAISNDTTGKAATASALAAVPAQCSTGQFATGIAANGNANCVTPSSNDKFLVASPACTPATSTDSSCTGSIAFGSSFADTNYGVWTQITESAGALLFMTVTSKTTSGISYVITCTFNCSAISQPTVDIYAHHP